LYWHVIDGGWGVAIPRIEVVVGSPPDVAPDRVSAFVYTSRSTGETATTDYSEERAANFLTVRLNRPLRPREALAIRLAWPPGTFVAPARSQELAWLVSDHWPIGLPFLALAAGLLVWRRSGRDPSVNRSVTPQYAPPPDLAPAEAGTLIDERVHPRDIIATLVDLAVRGYIEIEQVTRADDEPDFLFRRLKPVLGDPGVKPFELFVLAKLFDTDWTLNMRLLSEVRRDYDNVFPPIRDAIYCDMVRSRLFSASPRGVRSRWFGLGAAVAVVAGVLWLQAPDWVPAAPSTFALGLGCAGVVIAALGPLMPRRSRYGARLLTEVLGFQEFLERAEKDRLERLPPDTLHRWLPWAIALGVTERWIFNWDGVLVDKPGWFASDQSFSLTGYHQAIATFGRRTEEALLTTRRAPSGV
jgi:hypothetical protein